MFSEVRHTSVCISKERQSDFIVKGINVSHFSIEVFYIKTVRGVLPVLHTSILWGVLANIFLIHRRRNSFSTHFLVCGDLFSFSHFDRFSNNFTNVLDSSDCITVCIWVAFLQRLSIDDQRIADQFDIDLEQFIALFDTVCVGKGHRVKVRLTERIDRPLDEVLLLLVEFLDLGAVTFCNVRQPRLNEHVITAPDYFIRLVEQTQVRRECVLLQSEKLEDV